MHNTTNTLLKVCPKRPNWSMESALPCRCVTSAPAKCTHRPCPTTPTALSSWCAVTESTLSTPVRRCATRRSAVRWTSCGPVRVRETMLSERAPRGMLYVVYLWVQCGLLWFHNSFPFCNTNTARTLRYTTLHTPHHILHTIHYSTECARSRTSRSTSRCPCPSPALTVRTVKCVYGCVCICGCSVVYVCVL